MSHSLVRYGRDTLNHYAYRRDAMSGRGHPILAAVAGFLLVPIVTGVLSRFVVRPGTPNAAVKVAGFHAAGALAAYFGAEKFPGAHSFLRGGMWGEGVNTLLAGAAVALNPQLDAVPTQSPAGTTTSASLVAHTQDDAHQKIKDLVTKVVQGRWLGY